MPFDQADLLVRTSKEYGVPISAAEFTNEPNLIALSGLPKGYTAEDHARDHDLFGAWLKENGESIYGCSAAPDFPYKLDWVCFTYKPETKTLYMHITKWPYKNHGICITGLTTKVRRARLLKTGEEIPFFQTYETDSDEHRLSPVIPAESPDALYTVIAFELEDDPSVQSIIDRR